MPGLYGRFGEERQKIRLPDPHCPRGLQGGQPLLYLDNGVLGLSLRGECPALEDEPRRAVEGKAVCLAENLQRLGLLTGVLWLTSKVMDYCQKKLRVGLAWRVGQLLCPTESVVRPP